MNASATFIREATEDDLPLWLALAKERYPGRDVSLSEKWVRLCIRHPDRLVLIGQACAGIAAVDWCYGIERRGYLAILYSIPGLAPVMARSLEIRSMLTTMVAWAKKMGAEPPFNVEAGTGVDFWPFVKQMGGTGSSLCRYEIPF